MRLSITYTYFEQNSEKNKMDKRNFMKYHPKKWIVIVKLQLHNGYLKRACKSL